MKFEFSSKVVKKIGKIDKIIAKRILDKLMWYSMQTNPLQYAEEIIAIPPITHRFRIGNLRIIGIYIKIKDIFLVVDIGNRGQIYKQKPHLLNK